MSQRGYLRQQFRVDILPGHQQLCSFDPRCLRRDHEIPTLRHEQPELVAPPAVVELTNELELLVLARADQECSSASADLAFSAMAPNALGSVTARSASTLRSS